jgi:glycosyltransferase 2 family protein
MAGKNTKAIIQFSILLSIGIFLIWLSLRAITPEQQTEIFISFKTANYFWIIVSMAIALFYERSAGIIC